jgi:hypothetical protein
VSIVGSTRFGVVSLLFDLCKVSVQLFVFRSCRVDEGGAASGLGTRSTDRLATLQ